MKKNKNKPTESSLDETVIEKTFDNRNDAQVSSAPKNDTTIVRDEYFDDCGFEHRWFYEN